MTKNRDSSKSSSGLTWAVVVPSVVAAIIANHFYPSWGRVVLTSAVLLGGFIGIFRRFWKYWWFWTTILLATIAHCILAAHFRGFLNDLNIFSLFGLVMLEVVGFALVLSVPVSLFAKDEAAQ
ncbi:MAG: hypothetical protein ABSD63_08050 [Candidatus Korobacteraceae bacterium]|jgi:hypothetical protein